MTKTNRYFITAMVSSISTILILLLLQIIFSKDLPYSRAYLLSGTLLQNYNLLGMGIIAISAGLLSYFTDVRPILIAVFTIAIFPILSIYEILRYPTSHNLFMLEIVMYIIMGLPPFFGALVGYRLKHKRSTSALTSNSSSQQYKGWWGF